MTPTRFLIFTFAALDDAAESACGTHLPPLAFGLMSGTFLRLLPVATP
jgi:hypothetical protein